MGATWYFLQTPPYSGATNMAVDEAMLALARSEGRHIFRIYSWTHPTVSFGRNQAVAGVYDPAKGQQLGVGFVRRLTGGRALVHGQEITYSVTLPADPTVRPRALYDQINTVLISALRELGVTVETTGAESQTPPPAAGVCFSEPSRGELTWKGKKLVGSAQVRVRNALLQHGSIIVRDDQQLLGRLTMQPIPLAPPAASLAEALGRTVEPSEFAAAARHALRTLWTEDVRDFSDHAQLEALSRSMQAKYESAAWTWAALADVGGAL